MMDCWPNDCWTCWGTTNQKEEILHTHLRSGYITITSFCGDPKMLYTLKDEGLVKKKTLMLLHEDETAHKILGTKSAGEALWESYAIKEKLENSQWYSGGFTIEAMYQTCFLKTSISKTFCWKQRTSEWPRLALPTTDGV